MKLRIFYSFNNIQKVFETDTLCAIVGRPTNRVPVDLDLSPDLKVSRPHARIWCDEGEFWIQDLGSLRGTHVGGVDISGRGKWPLKTTDTCVMGSTFLGLSDLRSKWATDIASNNATDQLALDSDAAGLAATTLLTLDELRLPASHSIRYDFLSGLPTHFGDDLELDELLQAVTQRLVEIIPGSSHSAVLLKDRNTGKLVLRGHFPFGTPAVSLSLAQKAIDQTRGFIWTREAEITQSQRRNLSQCGIYVPVLREGKAVGVICVDSSLPAHVFGRDDLRLLLSVSQYCSVAVENHYLREELQRQTELTGRLFCSRFPPRLRAQLLHEASSGLLVTGTRQSHVTILAADIRGFTQLTTRIGPQKMRELLNEYFPPLIEAIHDCEGTVERFVGDAIFAVFGSPQMDDQQEERALRAAVRMQTSMAVHNALRSAGGSEACCMGIGIHCGQALNGFVGDSRYIEFTVLGEPANLAGRYCNGAGASEILLSPELHARVFHLARCEPVTINMKHEGECPAYRFRHLY